ncbi:hypothetical protein GWI33_008306 [Rhynchophorus ferrugineus]|uniref:C2H2-type domain-containing protein n=1 Tax=Rhynchophorus ferrugineus TaxID=354439 RepID=A0A834MJB6_RHYFE|nr:hypothetical protein GWI33_008306 [Rhynchophorus ferrugineus]
MGDLEEHELDCACGDSNLYTCKCCQHIFDETAWTDHVNRIKLQRTVDYVCCNISFDDDFNYKDHIKTFHMENVLVSNLEPVVKTSPTVSCRYCDQVFANQNLTIAHERKVHGDQVIQCDICSKHLKLERFRAHKITHRTKKHYYNTPAKVCNVCGLSVKNLERHLVTHENLRKHSCTKCEKSFKLSWDLKRHMVVHSDEAKYKCDVCDKTFKVAFNLRVHMRIHEGVKPFACLVCDKSYTTKQSRDNHLKTHDRISIFNTSDLLRCKCCTHIFETQELLIKHSIGCFDPKDRNKRSKEVQCTECGQVFAEKGHLRMHRNYVHSGSKYAFKQGDFQCNDCNKSFSKLPYLDKHRKRVHQEAVDEDLPCPECSKTFKKQDTRRKHIKVFHGGYVPCYKCDVCGEKCKGRNGLENHKQTVHLNKPICSLCCQEFNNEADLNSHKVAVHNVDVSVYDCPETGCLKIFTSEELLKCHLEATHMKERKFCSETFTDPVKYDEHIHQHRQNKLYKCDICDKELSGNHRLLEHRRIHTGEKPYSCKSCDQKFATKQQLDVHKTISSSPYENYFLWIQFVVIHSFIKR